MLTALFRRVQSVAAVLPLVGYEFGPHHVLYREYIRGGYGNSECGRIFGEAKERLLLPTGVLTKAGLALGPGRRVQRAVGRREFPRPVKLVRCRELVVPGA